MCGQALNHRLRAPKRQRAWLRIPHSPAEAGGAAAPRSWAVLLAWLQAQKGQRQVKAKATQERTQVWVAALQGKHRAAWHTCRAGSPEGEGHRRLSKPAALFHCTSNGACALFVCAVYFTMYFHVFAF